jgi:transcriptional regulator with XRE-family HTH domain
MNENHNLQFTDTDTEVGRKLRQLRAWRGLSLRALAELSGLNVNTLSLIENSKTSPSVNTLQQLARSLQVPITAFFESAPSPRAVIFTPAGQRPAVQSGSVRLQNLARDLSNGSLQSFVVALQPEENSGDTLIVHTGYEFIYGLAGSVQYRVAEDAYALGPGDALVFEAHLPHCWKNVGQGEAQFLLILQPADPHDAPVERHFQHAIY